MCSSSTTSRSFAGRSLRLCGAAGDIVSEADSAKAAIHALTNAPEPTDVVILDYQLSDSHDLGLLAKVRQLSPQSQVILMSAHCTPDIANEALGIGTYRVLNKPLDMDNVPALVRDRLSRLR